MNADWLASAKGRFLLSVPHSRRVLLTARSYISGGILVLRSSLNYSLVYGIEHEWLNPVCFGLVSLSDCRSLFQKKAIHD